MLDEWLELLDEHGMRAIGADVRVVVANGKAPPLMELCATTDVRVDAIERSITQEPSQCDEREVDESNSNFIEESRLPNDSNIFIMGGEADTPKNDRLAVFGDPPASMEQSTRSKIDLRSPTFKPSSRRD